MRLRIKISILFLCFLSSGNSQQTLGTIVNDSLALNGYTLFAPSTSTFLIDNCGRLINEWESNTRPGLAAYLLDNGNLIRAGAKIGPFNGPGFGGLLEEYDWEGNLVWTYDVYSDDFQQHHDIEILPNGNILFIAWESKSEDDAIEAGSRQSSVYWAPVVYEIQKIGFASAEVVWEWHLWDHLIQDFDSTKINYGVVSDHPELFNVNMQAPQGLGSADWLHLNGIDYDHLRDEIILSSRHMSEIYIIDHSTTTSEAKGHSGGKRGRGGDLLYRWGNPRAYDKGTNVQQKLFGQHNAEVVPSSFPGAGNITIFNNGNNRPEGNYSSIDEIKPPRDADGNYYLEADGTFGPSNLEWQFIAEDKESFFSSNMGGVQRLRNGNTLICESRKSRFFEVNTLGEILWEYENPVGMAGTLTEGDDNDGIAAAFRANKFPIDFVAFQDKELAPGEVLELDPLPFECSIYDVVSSTVESDIKEQFDITLSYDQFLHIENKNGETFNYKILDFSGRSLMSGDILGFVHLDIGAFKTGIYILNFRNKQGSTSIKIFKP